MLTYALWTGMCCRSWSASRRTRMRYRSRSSCSNARQTSCVEAVPSPPLGCWRIASFAKMAVSEDASMPNVTVEEVICVKGGRLDKKTVNVPFEVETVGSADVRVFRVRKRDTWLVCPFVTIKDDMKDVGKVELHPKFDGKQMIMVIQPL
mgnify:CR=1 FL=1